MLWIPWRETRKIEIPFETIKWMVCICGLYEKTGHFIICLYFAHSIQSNSHKIRIKYGCLSEYLCACEVWSLYDVNERRRYSKQRWTRLPKVVWESWSHKIFIWYTKTKTNLRFRFFVSYYYLQIAKSRTSIVHRRHFHNIKTMRMNL